MVAVVRRGGTVLAVSEGEAEQSIAGKILELGASSCEIVDLPDQNSFSGSSVSLHPVSLQNEIKALLKLAPNVCKAHFLSYLNALRVGSVCEAADSLRRYFDLNRVYSFDPEHRNESSPNANGDGDVSWNKERKALFQYISLSLAVMNLHFGFLDEAKKSLGDCMRTAQEVNDQRCLANAMGWLYRLLDMESSISYSMKANKHLPLLEKFVSRASELSLNDLSIQGDSLLVQNHLRYGKTPSDVLKTLLHSAIECAKNFDNAAKVSST